MKSIVVFGNTSAATTCAIYLKTGNHDVTIIKCNSNIPYKCSVVGGVTDPENFTQKTFDQCKWLNIKVIEDFINLSDVSVKYNKDEKTFEMLSGKTKKFDFMFFESESIFQQISNDTLDKTNKSIYIMDDLLQSNKNIEGIVLAAEGCKLSFKFKEEHA